MSHRNRARSVPRQPLGGAKTAPCVQQLDRTQVLYRGRRYAYFGGCDYYRLASHPEVIQALKDGLEAYGLNVAASRMTTGNHPVYGRLERRLSNFFGAPTALVVSSGYMSNTIVAQALAGEFTHVFLDAKAHASLCDAAAYFGCPTASFDHRDVEALRALLKAMPKSARPIVLTDGLFGQDGSIAPLAGYLEVLPDNGRVLVDDSHGAGVLGDSSRGTLEHAGVDRDRCIQTMTLSKALGVFGGVILGNHTLRDKVLRRSRAFHGSTPFPLPLACAAERSLQLLRKDRTLRDRLHQNVALVKRALKGKEIHIEETPSPIIAFDPGTPAHADQLRRRLRSRRIYPSFIRYPGGPENGFFRIALSSEHTAAQLNALVSALNQNP